jgi:hypothetical protein
MWGADEWVEIRDLVASTVRRVLQVYVIPRRCVYTAVAIAHLVPLTATYMSLLSPKSTGIPRGSSEESRSV